MTNLIGVDCFICEDCDKQFTDFYEYKDDYYHQIICEDCFNERFAKEAKDKNTDWFENNFWLCEKSFPKLMFLQS